MYVLKHPSWLNSGLWTWKPMHITFAWLSAKCFRKEVIASSTGHPAYMPM